MSNRFRNSLFSGFDRKDVVSYVTGQAQEKELLAQANAALSEEVSRLRAELDDAHARISEMEQAAESCRAAADKAERELAAMKETVSGVLRQLTFLTISETPSGCEDDHTPADISDMTMTFDDTQENEL